MKKKLKLSVEDLPVDTFATEEATDGQGTVAAANTGLQTNCCALPTAYPQDCCAPGVTAVEAWCWDRRPNTGWCSETTA
ncbi:MAG: hypothetical protein JO306_13060 [Gemmatimonadetes bacterium]|nr:hypothetical protein [Gemmatimonadota bacterium]